LKFDQLFVSHENIWDVVEQFCQEVYEVRGSEVADRMEDRRVKCEPNENDNELFKRWGYISTTATREETKAAADAGFLKLSGEPSGSGN